MARPTRTTNIRTRRTIPSPTSMPAASEATPVANGFTVEASTPGPGPEEDDRGRDEAVVVERQDQGHEQREEAEGLLPHAVGRAAEREDAHQGDHQHVAAVLEAERQAPDARLDRLGLHRHADERADREDEQEDHRRAVEEPRVERVDVAALVLDPVEAVGDRGPELLQLLGDRLVDALDALLDVVARRELGVACPGFGPPVFGIDLVGARGDDERQTPDDQEDDRQDRERGRESPLLGLGGSLSLVRHLFPSWSSGGRHVTGDRVPSDARSGESPLHQCFTRDPSTWSLRAVGCTVARLSSRLCPRCTGVSMGKLWTNLGHEDPHEVTGPR